MSLELWIAIIAIVVEGPIVWWISSHRRKEDNTMTHIQEVKASVRKIHERIDEVEQKVADKYATKEEVDDKVEHVKEVVNVQYASIMETLNYIRSRVDEQRKSDK